MDSVDNTLITVIVQPVSNRQDLAASVLPERFVSESRCQPSPIMGDDFGSCVRLVQRVGTVEIAPIFA